MLLTDFCNRPTSRAPAVDRSIPGVLVPLSRSAHLPTEFPPPDTPGRLAFDDAIRASVDPSLTRSAIWRSRAPLNPGGLRYRRALEGAPPVPRRCLPRARSARRPLTLPVATSAGSFDPLPAARTAFPQSPVKDPDSVRSEAPSIDECPLDAPAPLSERRTNLEREPATGLGASPPFNPASDALSPPRLPEEEVARPRPLPRALHARALLATRRSSTSATEKRSASTTVEPRNPARCDGPRERIRLSTRVTRLSPSSSSCESVLILIEGAAAFTTTINRKGAEDSRVRGRLIAMQSMIALPASLLGDRSPRRLRPNPIGSNTSCRATRVDYDRSTVIESSSAPANFVERIRRARPRGHPLARVAFRGGPPPAPLREKEMRSAAPEVLSIPGLPLAGSALSPQFVPKLWIWWARAFSISAPFLRTDGALGATWTRPLSGA